MKITNETIARINELAKKAKREGLAEAEKEEQKKVRHEEDLTLIQGIIDVFWIEKDGIVLLDYKTDRVDTEKELSERYAAQLKLYEEALNRVYENEKDAAGNPLKVKEKLLYSFRLGKVIPV